MDATPSRAQLTTLAWLNARATLITFGGGTATAEVLRRSLGKRGWLGDDDHRRLFAISRLTPGTNLIAYCTAVGLQIRGAAGAVVAWLAASVPASVVAVLVTVFYEYAAKSATLAIVVLIGTAIALVLLLASAWQLAKPSLLEGSRARSGSVIAVSLILMAAGLQPIAILVAGALVGAAWPVTAR